MSKKKKSNFRNQTVSDAKRQKRRASFGYLNLPKGMKTFSIEENTRSVKLDIIPYEVTDEKHPDRDDKESRAVPGNLWYKRPFKIHRNIGVDNETVICLTSVKKKCPVCEWVKERLKRGADWDDVVDASAKDRNLYAVIPIDSDTHDEELCVWDMAQFLFQNELNDQLEEDPDNGIFPDLEEGLTLNVKLKWKKFGRNMFPETRDIKFIEREEQYSEDILEDVPNLDEVLKVLTYDELQAKFLEMEDEDNVEDVDEIEEEEEEEETPRKPRRKKPVRKQKREEEPEEEEEEPEEEEEEPKKEKPRRTRGSQKSKSKRPKCPYGHKFGKDWDDHDDCAECDEWDACSDAVEQE